MALRLGLRSALLSCLASSLDLLSALLAFGGFIVPSLVLCWALHLPLLRRAALPSSASKATVYEWSGFGLQSSTFGGAGWGAEEAGRRASISTAHCCDYWVLHCGASCVFPASVWVGVCGQPAVIFQRRLQHLGRADSGHPGLLGALLHQSYWWYFGLQGSCCASLGSWLVGKVLSPWSAIKATSNKTHWPGKQLLHHLTGRRLRLSNPGAPSLRL